MKKLDCYGKINVTLRITGKNDRGFHNLSSLFLKIGPLEALTIKNSVRDNVRVLFNGKELCLTGQNTVEKALLAARGGDAAVPFFECLLEKRIPPGTGLGAGSGDAAALLQYLCRQGYRADRAAERVGADVPFLLSSARLARAEGIGEILTVLPDESLPLSAAVAIPSWRCMTSDMFCLADEFWASWPATQDEARRESDGILAELRRGKKTGLLPNDFLPPLMIREPRYQVLFEEFEQAGALAWGLSGSGSAAFALWPIGAMPSALRLRQSWVEKIFLFP